MNPAQQARLAQERAMVLKGQGRYEEARRLHKESLKIFDQLGDQRAEGIRRALARLSDKPQSDGVVRRWFRKR